MRVAAERVLGLTGTSRDRSLFVLGFVLLVAGTAAAVAAAVLRHQQVLAAAVAGVGLTTWLLSNGPSEGPTLMVLAAGNGLTAADVLAVPGLAALGLLRWQDLRPTSSRGGD